MTTVFVLCMALGGGVLVIQIVLGFLGMADAAPELVDDVDGASGALNLLSVRALAAGTVMFGAAGLALAAPLPIWLATPLAFVPAFAATFTTAYLTRLMFRAESRGNLRLDEAAGALGTVYLRVPAANGGTGIVQFTLQGRTVELPARTREASDLATGSAVLVISVDTESETAEVISSTSIEGLEP
jgi:hypothetical protein